MLLNSDGITKPGIVSVTKEVWDELKQRTHSGIKEKLAASKQLLDSGGSVEIAAGLYTFAVEEYGKLLLLQKSETVKTSNNRIINYASEFANHKKKIELALDDLQLKRHEECYVLNDEGGFDPRSFSWRGFTIGLLADDKARLAIFLRDLSPPNDKPLVQPMPRIEKANLSRAIEGLETVLNSVVP